MNTNEPITEMSIPDFIREYHPDLTYPAIRYAVTTGAIDGYYDTKGWMVQLTQKTLDYRPIRSRRRAAKRPTTHAVLRHHVPA